jgi:hypothetical protein
MPLDMNYISAHKNFPYLAQDPLINCQVGFRTGPKLYQSVLFQSDQSANQSQSRPPDWRTSKVYVNHQTYILYYLRT